MKKEFELQLEQLNIFLNSKGYVLHKGSGSDKWKEKLENFSDIHYVDKNSSNLDSFYLDMDGTKKEIALRLWFDMPDRVKFQIINCWRAGIIVNDDFILVTKPDSNILIDVEKIKKWFEEKNIEDLFLRYPTIG